MAWLCAASGLLAGCNNSRMSLGGGNERVSAPLNSISIYQLAGRLNLAVKSNSSTMAVLQDRANVLMIYADPDGQAYVNGSPVGQKGNIPSVGDMLFVPGKLEQQIRAVLVVPVKKSAPMTISPPAPKPAGPKKVRIVIDPGHGGKDPGAISITGMKEKRIVLAAALEVAGQLNSAREGVDVTLTRNDDTFVALNRRADIANRRKADLFVSIHADSCRNRAVSGYTLYVARSASRRSLALARAIEGKLASLGIVSRGIKRANFRVLVRTTCPAVLVEMGYLSNLTEATKLSQQSYRNRIAGAISEGVRDYLRKH